MRDLGDTIQLMWCPTISMLANIGGLIKIKSGKKKRSIGSRWNQVRWHLEWVARVEEELTKGEKFTKRKGRKSEKLDRGSNNRYNNKRSLDKYIKRSIKDDIKNDTRG